jgi:hypothetical protein
MTKRNIPEEIKKQLAGTVPFSSSGTVDFIPSIYKDVPKEYKAVFKVSPYTQDEISEFRKLMNIVIEKPSDEDVLEAYQSLAELLRKKIKGWKNYIDIGTGEDILFKPEDRDGGVDKELWEADCLPSVFVSEISNYIAIISRLFPAEKLSLK